jgi:hypothetical protein
MAHAAILAQGQAFACGLQLLLARSGGLAGLQALRCLGMGLGHGLVACNVFTGVGIQPRAWHGGSGLRWR